MPKRVCDTCGKERDVAGGVTCESGHFICKDCKVIKGFMFDDKRKKCPICQKPLR